MLTGIILELFCKKKVINFFYNLSKGYPKAIQVSSTDLLTFFVDKLSVRLD
jgi:hypothetical protein